MPRPDTTPTETVTLPPMMRKAATSTGAFLDAFLSLSADDPKMTEARPHLEVFRDLLRAALGGEVPGREGLRALVREAVRNWSDQPECDKLASHEEDEVTDAVVAALERRS
jgi:hypothetical protein